MLFRSLRRSKDGTAAVAALTEGEEAQKVDSVAKNHGDSLLTLMLLMLLLLCERGFSFVLESIL